MHYSICRARIIAATLLVSTVMGTALADSVRVREGNIELVKVGAVGVQLTDKGSVVEAAQSPDGQLIAYVEATPDQFIEGGAGRVRADELWVMNADGTGARRLLEGRDAKKAEFTLARFSNLHFAPNGDEIFFLTRAWATSDAVHAVNLKTGRELFICDGNSLEVVAKGRNKGNLLVRKHKYRREGGSYNWVWLVSPTGRDIKVVSRTE